MIEVEVLDPASDQQPPDWAAFFTGQRLHAPWDYPLLAIEAGGPHPLLLALVRRDGVLACAVVGLVARRGRSPRWIEVFHPWISGEPGWVFAGDVDPAERRAMLRAAERALCRRAGRTCVGLVYWHFPVGDGALVGGFGRHVRDCVGTAVLDNTFADTTAWLAALSRNRRASLRKLRRQVDSDPGIVLRFETARRDLDPVALAAMLRAHRAKHGSHRHDSRNPVTAEYLGALLARDDVRTMTYHDTSGTLLAWSNLLEHPTHLFSQHYAALPDTGGGRNHLYFDLYTRLVDQLTGQGAESLSVGRGMAEVKTRLGFQLRPRRLAVVPRLSVR